MVAKWLFQKILFVLKARVSPTPVLIAVFFCFAIGVSAVAAVKPGTIVTIELKNYKEGMKRLQSLNFDIAGVDRKNSLVDIAVDSDLESQKLAASGFKIHSRKAFSATFAPDSQYMTYDDMSMKLELMVATHSNIAMMKSFGDTNDHRKIRAFKISDNVEEDEVDEPAILFNAMHHAREIMTTEIAVDIVEYLLTNYGTDPEVTAWVDNNEIWVVPMVNPDGNHKVWNGRPMWRKNTKNGYGVDLNRNYPYLWDGCNGSSGNTRADDYRGPQPGSELETQAMMRAVAEINPIFDISYHSYSEMVIHPLGCEGMHTPLREVVEDVSSALAGKLVRDSGTGTYDSGTAWELLYSADGGDLDWMYHNFEVIPFVIEVGSRSRGFQPPYSVRNETVRLQRPGWQYLLNRLDASGVRGLIKDSEGKLISGIEIRAKKLGAEAFVEHIFHSKSDGSYHLVLKPGMYELNFGNSQVHEVLIGSDRLDLNVSLAQTES